MTRSSGSWAGSVCAAVAVLALSVGCSAGSAGSAGKAGSAVSKGANAPTSGLPGAPATGAVSAVGGGPVGDAGTKPVTTLPPLPRPVTSDRDLIRTGAVTVRVGDLAKAARQVADIASGAAGAVYDERTDQQHEPGVPATSTLTLRVAPERFDDAMNALDGIGQRLDRSVSVTDVTEQVADVAARLDSQRASVARVRDLLTQAKSLADVVTLESELTRRQADLESLQARSKALAAQASLATITVHLQTGPPAPPRAVRHTGFLAGLAAGWRAFSRATGALATGLGALLPFLVLLTLLGVVGWRLRARSRRTASSRPPLAAPSE
ncbi:MAG: DUF4349 domain-containing protein [Actinomycetota bacterium]|nr:DUF4349 domain-containing protein [Actinomycetota bacterium]